MVHFHPFPFRNCVSLEINSLHIVTMKMNSMNVAELNVPVDASQHIAEFVRMLQNSKAMTKQLKANIAKIKMGLTTEYSHRTYIFTSAGI